MAKNNKGGIPKNAVKNELKKFAVRADSKDIRILGLVSSEIEANSKLLSLNPYVALKYFLNDWQCLSDWGSSELKDLSKFISSLPKHTWDQVYRTAGGIPKHGFGYTKYDLDDVHSESLKSKLRSVKNEISEDINFFELRVNQNKLRVHGFQSHSAFFLVALDRNHEAFPM